MFRIPWQPDALAEMTRITLANPARRSELAYALGFTEGRLSKNPLDEGESREGNRRVMFPDPLTVYFEVDEITGEAEVIWVELTR